MARVIVDTGLLIAFARGHMSMRQLANARLLSVHGYGHTVFLKPSACASAVQVAYLVDGTLPAEGTVCRQDTAPSRRPPAVGRRGNPGAGSAGGQII